MPVRAPPSEWAPARPEMLPHPGQLLVAAFPSRSRRGPLTNGVRSTHSLDDAICSLDDGVPPAGTPCRQPGMPPASSNIGCTILQELDPGKFYLMSPSPSPPLHPKSLGNLEELNQGEPAPSLSHDRSWFCQNWFHTTELSKHCNTDVY